MIILLVANISFKKEFIQYINIILLRGLEKFEGFQR
jgi:hypothetical protein